MIVAPDGSIAGSPSGWALEAIVIQEGGWSYSSKSGPSGERRYALTTAARPRSHSVRARRSRTTWA